MLFTVVRHAQSLGNAGMLTEDDPDPRLSPLGIEQARLTAQRLAPQEVTHIWSSPFRRAVQTASFLAQARGIEVLLEADMVEHYIFDDLKDYTGRRGTELHREFACVAVPDGFDDGPWTPEWGESWEQLKARTRRVAEKALELDRSSSEARAPAGEVVHLAVFGHGASCKALLCSLVGEEIAQDAPFVNAGISRVRLDGSLPGETVFLSDASHLAAVQNEGT